MNTPYHYAVAYAEQLKKDEKMTAYELADACMGARPWLADEDVMTQAATMLRKQAQEIIRLKLEWQELYTHPIKELTDKEIQEVYSKQHEIPPNILAFAKAILRKAQEK